MAKIFIAIIRLYQIVISPCFSPKCRYYPTSSADGGEAITKYGALKGGFMILKRICRCHPFNPGGYDPVP
ncbi:MAG: membrane protein insertion efficiency factor YidD [Acidaminococcaceae bacterium]|nr:membrane protein insertion efficiency factor YidD [Acidaminococcaceae bacterium]